MASLSHCIPALHEKSVSLFSILPQSTVNGSNITNILEGTLLITRITRDALNAFLGKELHLFDALVGDEACHIRAVKIQELSLRTLHDPIFQEALCSMGSKMDPAEKTLRHLAKNPPNLHKKTSVPIGRFLEEYHADVLTDQDIFFVVQSYFLTLTKEDVEGKDRTTTGDLSKLSPLSERILRDLVKSVQKNLATLSVEYVQKCAQELDDGSETFVSGPMQLIDEAQRPQISCFFSIDILLKRMMQTGQNVLIKIVEKPSRQTAYLFYRPEGERFVLCPWTQKQRLDTALVIEGNCFSQEGEPPFEEKLRTLEQEDLVDIILAGAAQHSHYAGQKLRDTSPDLSAYPDAQRRIQEYAHLAFKKGFALSNPSLFCIEHIFASKLERELPSL